MPGKLLIVDSIATNRIVLKVRLANAFYEIAQAANASDLWQQLKRETPDLILINGHLEDCKATALCQKLRAKKQTAHLPIVLICSIDDRSERLAALEAGANDVLVRPLDDLVLLARLRSLLRTHETAEESKLRERTTQALGYTAGFAEAPGGFAPQTSVHLATPDAATGERWATILHPRMPYRVIAKVHGEALKDMASAAPPDVFVIALDRHRPEAGLRLVAEIRARASTRHAGILVVLDDDRRRTLVDAMDLGAHDVMAHGFDPDEMALRVSTLVSQKKLGDRLRSSVDIGLQAAVTDPLTGLFNRRYALPHLERIREQAVKKKRTFALMVADLDHFKSVNDRYGHAAGDAVLAEAARRIRENLRAIDLVARIGGEEFLIALPETDAVRALDTAKRLCAKLRDAPVLLSGQNFKIPVTMSVGVVVGDGTTAMASVDTLLKAADRALYEAKSLGRDRPYIAENLSNNVAVQERHSQS